MTPIRAILTAYNPRFADFRPVIEWMTGGADVEQDILPVLRYWTQKKPDIFSVRFFTPYVLRARDARLEAEKPAAPMEDRTRAARIAFITRVAKIWCDPRAVAWLERYERENGAIELEQKSVAGKPEA